MPPFAQALQRARAFRELLTCVWSARDGQRRLRYSVNGRALCRRSVDRLVLSQARSDYDGRTMSSLRQLTFDLRTKGSRASTSLGSLVATPRKIACASCRAN